MGTFKKETDRIIEVLKKTEKEVFIADEVFSCSLVMLSDLKAPHSKDAFLLNYRGLNFLFVEGNAWNTPGFKDELVNAPRRWELYWLTVFLACKQALLKKEEFQRELNIALSKFKEGDFLDYLTESLKKEGHIQPDLREEEADICLSLLYYLIDKCDILGSETVLNILSITSIYAQYFPFLENLLKDFPEELRELYEINEALRITNPTFSPSEAVKTLRSVPATCPEELEKLNIEPYRTIPVDLVIFLPENWEQEEPTLLQLQIGAILYQHGKLTEEEKNELVYLVAKLGIKVDSLALVTALKGDKERKDRKLNGRILGFKGGATPKGILAYVRKVGKNERVKNALPQEEGEDWVELPDEPEGKEEWEEVAEGRFYFPIPPNNLYKNPHKWQLPPRNQYATLWEVAGELAVTFPGRMKSREVWRAWLYRQISAGRLQAVQLEKEYKLSDNVSYVAKHYFLTPDEVERAIKLYEQQEEQFAQKKRRAELIKELAKTKNVGIRQAQKIAKGKTDEELTKYIKELKGGQNESA